MFSVMKIEGAGSIEKLFSSSEESPSEMKRGKLLSVDEKLLSLERNMSSTKGAAEKSEFIITSDDRYGSNVPKSSGMVETLISSNNSPES
jgi:hypothetical protein